MSKKDFEIVIKINKQTLIILSMVLALLIVSGGAFIFLKSRTDNLVKSGEIKGAAVALAEKTTADDIYPQFVCTCCNQPLDKNNICCGIAKDMIAFIDTQVNSGASEGDVALATVKKYGLKSLSSETAKEDIKERLAKDAPADSPKINLEPRSYDFGEVSQAQGEVSHSFTLQNTGKTDLIINNLLSSCGCTTAALVVDGQEGPRFGMHENPKNWSATIEPGESAELKVYYDPNVHPDFRGLATREVTVFSNDPVDFEKSIKIKLNQVN